MLTAEVGECLYMGPIGKIGIGRNWCTLAIEESSSSSKVLHIIPCEVLVSWTRASSRSCVNSKGRSLTLKGGRSGSSSSNLLSEMLEKKRERGEGFDRNIMT